MIAFSGMKGGVTDLWTIDLATRASAMTNDPFADLHPAWSPDGRALAFRRIAATNLASLTFGACPASAYSSSSHHGSAVRRGHDHVNPCGAARRAAAAIYFVGDRDGIGNVFRLETGSSHHPCDRRHDRRQRGNSRQPVRSQWRRTPARSRSACSRTTAMSCSRFRSSIGSPARG